MADTIRRGARSVRRQGRSQPAARKSRSNAAQRSSLMDGLMRVLPFTEEQLHKFFLSLILIAVLAVALIIANLSGATAVASERAAIAMADAGFEVRKVEVRGVERMNEVDVYERVLGVQERAMPQVNLSELRDSLMQLPYVDDARVSRQLPDTIVVDIVERRPHAVLRTARGLALIDENGHVLEPIKASEAKKHLIISGKEAEQQVQALTTLLAAAPELQEQVTEAEWIGRRRWNLTFATGQVLSLPQGEERSRAALMSFSKLDGANRLIGGRVASFDMRNPDRIYMRVPGRAQEAALAAKQKDS